VSRPVVGVHREASSYYLMLTSGGIKSQGILVEVVA
jgi:hypothetical protein